MDQKPDSRYYGKHLRSCVWAKYGTKRENKSGRRKVLNLRTYGWSKLWNAGVEKYKTFMQKRKSRNSLAYWRWF